MRNIFQINNENIYTHWFLIEKNITFVKIHKI